jgi:hypothetical protein
MTLKEFLDEFLDPKFQEMMKIVEKVLTSRNSILESKNSQKTSSSKK